jgi:protein involved in sex pheromone biosynthesis
MKKGSGMKKHLTILFCAVILGISYCSTNALGREDQLKQSDVRSMRSEQNLQKLIARQRRTLSQLKRTRARLLLKQAFELAN